MKKKLFINFFTVAVLTVAVGLVFSCKDYDDEIRADLQGQISDLNADLGNLLNKHEEDVESLKNDLADAKEECQNNIDAAEDRLTDLINQAKTDADATYATKQALADSIAKYAMKIAEANANIDLLDAKIDSLDAALTAVDEMQTDSIDKILEILNNLGWTSGDAINEWNEQYNVVVNNAKNAYDLSVQNNQTINNYGVTLDSIKNVLENLPSTGPNCDCTDLIKRIDSLANVTDTLLVNELATVKARAEEVLNEAKAYTDEHIKHVADSLKTLDSSVKALDIKVADMKKAYEYADSILADRLDTLEADVAELTEQVNKNTQAIETLTNKFMNVMSKRISSIVLQGAYSPVVGYFALPTGAKSNILAAYYGNEQGKFYFPTSRTGSLYGDRSMNFTSAEMAHIGITEEIFGGDEYLVDDTEGNAGTLYMTVNPNDVDLSETQFALVNSIGEAAPVALSTPVKSDYKLTFGYTRAGKNNGFYESKATLPVEAVESAQIKVDLGAIKDAIKDVTSIRDGINFTELANTIYSHVNEVADANAVEATWEDSLGIHSVYSDYGIAAVAIKPLSYAFDPASVVNTDYIPGYSRVKNFLNETIDKAVNKVISILPNFDKFDIETPTISKIEIADLSDELLAKFNVTIKDTVEYVWKDTISIDDIVIEDKNIPLTGQEVWIPEQTIKVPNEFDSDSTTVTIPGRYVAVDGVNVKVDGETIVIDDVIINEVLEIPVEVSYDMTEAIEELYGDMTGSIKDVNKMLEDLEGFMDDINEMLDELEEIANIESSIEETAENVKKRLNDYLDEINSKYSSFMKGINDKLQPNLLLSTKGGFASLSSVKKVPTTVKGTEIVVIPTSYTAEMIAPAFKKFVVVSNVYKGTVDSYSDATCKSVLDAANADLKTILPGHQRTVSINGKAGYVYEITYSAMDYSGKVSTTRHYVKFAE